MDPLQRLWTPCNANGPPCNANGPPCNADGPLAMPADPQALRKCNLYGPPKNRLSEFILDNFGLIFSQNQAELGQNEYTIMIRGSNRANVEILVLGVRVPLILLIKSKNLYNDALEISQNESLRIFVNDC